jgi:hypothetical protein
LPAKELREQKVFLCVLGVLGAIVSATRPSSARIAIRIPFPFLCLVPFDRLRALSKRSASKRRFFAAIPQRFSALAKENRPAKFEF